MKKLPYLITTFIIFGLVACNGAVQPITPTSTLLVMPTLHVTETSTPAITQTIPTPNQIPIALATATFLCQTKHPYDYLTSPDRKWMAVACNNDDLTSPSIQIAKLDGTKEWKPSFKDFAGIEYFEYERSPGVVSFMGEFLPYHWHKDSRYLFIAPTISSDLPIGAIPPDGVGLYRFDTQTGKFSPVLKFSKSSYDFSFSPNDEYYVYSYGLNEKNIHIINIQTGEEQTIQVPGYAGDIGRFIWSPNSFKFIFVRSDVENHESSLLLFDTIAGTWTTLRETDPADFFSLRLAPVKWVSNHQVLLEEPDWLVGFMPVGSDSSQRQEYILDIDTKQLSPFPTPK